MDIILIAAAGLSAPFLVLVLWRRIPQGLEIRATPRRWNRRAGSGRMPPGPETLVGSAEPKPAPSSGPILAEHTLGRDAVEQPGNAVRDVSPSAIRRLVVSGTPEVVKRSKRRHPSGSKKPPEPQWPDAQATHAYIRPSSEQACPRCRESASRGAAYCHACGRKLGTGVTATLPQPEPVLAADSQEKPRKEVGAGRRTSRRLERSSMP
jgi:hypothetical protein